MSDDEIQQIADRVIHTLEGLSPGGTNWWAVLLPPFAVLVGAGVAFYLGRQTLVTNRDAAGRTEWWKRAEWALTRLDSDADRDLVLGTEMLLVLTNSKLAGEDETAFLEAVWETIFEDDQQDDINGAEEIAEADEYFAQSGNLNDTELSLVQEYYGVRLSRGAVDEPAPNVDNGSSEEERP